MITDEDVKKAMGYVTRQMEVKPEDNYAITEGTLLARRMAKHIKTRFGVAQVCDYGVDDISGLEAVINVLRWRLIELEERECPYEEDYGKSGCNDDCNDCACDKDKDEVKGSLKFFKKELKKKHSVVVSQEDSKPEERPVFVKPEERRLYYVLDCFGYITKRYMDKVTFSTVIADIGHPGSRMYVCGGDDVWVVDGNKKYILTKKKCTYEQVTYVHDDGHNFSSYFFPFTNDENRDRLSTYIERDDLNWMVDQIVAAGYRFPDRPRMLPRWDGVHFLVHDWGMMKKKYLIEEIARLNEELIRVRGVPELRL